MTDASDALTTTGSNAAGGGRLDLGEEAGWERAAAALPYLFLLLPATFALLREWRPVVLALTVALLLWTALLSRPRTTGRLLIPIVYLTGTLALLAGLVHLDSLFTLTGVGVFIQIFTLLPSWRAYCGVAATAAVLVVARPRDGRHLGELVASFLVALLVASATGLLFSAISRQSEQRRLLITELRRTTAELAELAEENARLQAELLTSAREAGTLAERQRMAREIHDTVAQGLTGILTQLEAAEESPADPSTQARLTTIRTLARDNLSEVRRSIHALRPAPLADARLSAALDEVVAKWSRTNAIAAEFHLTGEARPLHPEVENTLLRVAQEGLANVAKHARATWVGLTLSYMEDVVALDLRDNGTGFVLPAAPVESRPAGGFGLVAMRQRVARLAGTLEVETGPGQGTALSATIPAIPAIPAIPDDEGD
ncbi:signal transduction histidine kinase [Kribbella amoyensis]|uniref:Signal transduction histidine kinase n=1 Tax=Kribbella amoyensis TaxID=996641 RepID=A0A561BYK9_9ACTN|nr:sensor histidine kinase [Kribbella amoyensis]TWD83943.1 signal transduction histidine kinase [Kribbella amoyensis]